MKKKTLGVTTALLAITTFSGSVAAAPIYFTDRASFEATIAGGLNFDSFETLSTINPPGATSSYDFGDFSLSETGGYNDVVSHTDTQFVTDGSIGVVYWDNGSSVGTFQFDAGINAFGVDIVTGWDTDVDISGGASFSLFSAAYTSSFFGVFDSDSLFNSISFDTNDAWTAANRHVGFDAVSYGVTSASVPEPNVALLMIAGLAFLGISHQKTRRNT